MASKNFKETNVPQAYSTGLYAEKQYNIAKEHAWKILDIMISGVAEVMRNIKSKEHPVVFIFKNGDDFMLACTVEFFPGADANKPGNWNMTWTFDESDVPTAEEDRARFVTPYDADMASIFWTYGINHHDFGFKGAEYLGTSLNYLVKLIKKWLDENASETEVMVLELPGVVQFKVQVENGEKVFSCEVDGEIKQRIKDDASIEV